MVSLHCERPGCDKKVEEADKTLALELLKLHDVQAHSIGNKSEKPRWPELAMSGDAVEDRVGAVRLQVRAIQDPGGGHQGLLQPPPRVPLPRGVQCALQHLRPRDFLPD